MATLFNKAFKPFIVPYESAPIQIHKKARLLAPAAAVIGVFGMVLCAVMAATGAIAVAGFLVGLFVFCAIVLLLMALGRYSAASSLFLYGLFAVMFAAIKFDAYKDLYECYVFGTLGSFLLIITGLVGVSGSQVFSIAFLDLAAIAALYVLDALPLDGGVVTFLAIQSLATTTIIVSAGGAFTARTVKLQSMLVDESARSADETKRQYGAFAGTLAKAQGAAMETGTRLAEAAARLSDSARALSDEASGETRGIAMLDATLAENEAAEAGILDAQAQVRSALGRYSQEVLEASAAVSQMIASIEAIARSSEERRTGVSRLVELARVGDERIDEISRAIAGIVSSTGRMDEMNTLIGDVSERTNMLGMNASIEAAHAGDAGKGFGVVAEEIRTLSEEAGEGSRVITTILDETRTVVANATRASADMRTFYGNMSEELGRVSETFSSLLSKLGEVSLGTAGVNKTMSGFSALSSKAESAAEETDKALKAASIRAAASRKVAMEMLEGATRMAKSCGALIAQSAALSELGSENVRRMESLKMGMDEA